jgi:hypothetical protein
MQDIVVRMQEHAGELRDEERVAGWAFRIAQLAARANDSLEHAARARGNVIGYTRKSDGHEGGGT